MTENTNDLSAILAASKAAHIKRIQDQVDLIQNNLPGPFGCVLDIGCGIAEQARELQQRFGSELWLVEGNRPNNSKKSPTASKSKWQDDANEFLYYWDLDSLRTRLENLGTKNFHLIDCDNIRIDAHIKFDLICSWKSCGYHYNINTYRDLILRHSHANTKIVMDIRNSKRGKRLPDDWRVVKELYHHGSKYVTCVIEHVG